MSGNDSDNESGKFSWTSDDELENKKPTLDCGTSFTIPKQEDLDAKEGSSSSGPSSVLFRHFVEAGFSEDLVAKAIEENGDGNVDYIMNDLLTYKHLKSSSSNEPFVESRPEIHQNGNFVTKVDDVLGQNLDVDSDGWSSDYDENILDDFSDSDACPRIEDISPQTSEEQEKFKYLKNMGYPMEEISIAISRCGHIFK